MKTYWNLLQPILSALDWKLEVLTIMLIFQVYSMNRDAYKHSLVCVHTSIHAYMQAYWTYRQLKWQASEASAVADIPKISTH